jgi:hypothetical protein
MYMAGMVCTITETTHTSVKLIKFAWTSDDAAGTAAGTTTSYYDGKIIWFVTDPGGTAPDDNYDITIVDGNSIDVLAGAGADRDTADTEYVAEASLGAVVASKLTLAVANAGNAKLGTIYLYIR